MRFNIVILFSFLVGSLSAQTLQKVNEISGGISPKSIVYNGNGVFSAQNMMYRHNVTLYNSSGELITTIEDEINLKAYGYDEYEADKYLGGPVEACFSEGGKFLWVSNYSMIGDGFNHEGCDACMGSQFDPSFIYKINTKTYQVENVIKVGAVPKYLALNEKTNVMVVSNWTSSDVSIIDLNTEKEIKRIEVGKHPRGVDITKDGQTAYVTVMGSTKIAVVDLQTYELSYIYNVGKSPRHLVLDEADQNLYCSINSASKIVKIDLKTNDKMTCQTKSGPRTMILSKNQRFLYVVNYYSDTFQKIDAHTMQVIETVKTGHHPIGITGNWETAEIWVACYEGRIQIFKDTELAEMELMASVADRPKLKTLPTYNSNEYFENQKQKKINELKKEEEKKAEEVVQNENSIEHITHTKDEVVTPAAIVNSTDCQYHLIIGSFGVRENAEKLKSKMSQKGYPAQLLPSANKKMTMVSIQCFSTENEALSSKSKILQDTQQKGWVYFKKN
ncbi:MAG: YVTN family beta-propeller repeat protein [Putridiphycobacter sp.]